MGSDAPRPSREDAPSLDQEPLLNTTLGGRYAIERELGSGGMAIVYVANDLKHDRKVAVKVLRPELASVIGPERFLREIEVAARLNHPHIVPVYDSGEADSLLFYVMPYVKGESLRQKLDRQGQLPIDEALDIVRHIGAALGYAHAEGVIHRDVKPENILLYEGVPMLMDFGIALAISASVDHRLTQSGLLVGTPDYMSPEQAVGERELDTRSDQYSLGCILYEMLAGEPPHQGPTVRAVLVKRLTEAAPSVRLRRQTVPDTVVRAVTKALSTVPTDRFESVVAFAEALSARASGPPRSRSVAVLPFVTLSTDPENEYFADGITEDVIAQLSHIRDLKVISRTSVMPFKKREQGSQEIAARLNVSTLLDGSVRRAGDRVRIVAHLIDAETDRHLWSETYDRELSDIFAIQTDVAMHIAEELEAKLSPGEETRLHRKPTSNIEAYQIYLHGRHSLLQLTEEDVQTAIEYFEQAVELDPDYALAYAMMALAYAELGAGVVGGALEPMEAYRRAKEAAGRALELDDGLAEAHSMLGLIKFSCDFDYSGAEEAFKRALELNPGNADTLDVYGRMLAGLERYDEALEVQERAHDIDPLEHRLDLVSTLLRAGRYEEALPPAERIVNLEPHFGHGHATLGWVYMKLGRTDEGLDELRQAVSLSPGNMMYQAQLGQALALAGDVQGANEVLQELEALAKHRYVSPYHLAYIYTGLGEHDRAMDCLEQAYEERGGGLYGIKGSFLFSPLRTHPRFTALLAKMNLA
jgi:serine/threonine-protein kinase